MNTWTQEKAIAFEAARECITDMMAIASEAIAEEEGRARPDQRKLAALEAELQRLAAEHRSLRLSDAEAVARVRTEYGAIIRADLARRRSGSASS